MELIYDHDLPTQFRAHNMYKAANFEAACAAFRQWCADNGVYYYSRPRETFFHQEAYQLATEAGCEKLLLEDLS